MKSLWLKKCYRLPWSETDNPNGWIEPTTRCNISCPGCYRGIDKPDHAPFTLDPDTCKKQIDWFATRRNIHTLSIAGGEPLLYPHLEEIVRHASESGLRVMIYTNGLLLDRKMLDKLENAGATQIMAHIDRFQKRPDIKPGEMLDPHRKKMCDLFANRKRIKLGFIQPLAAEFKDDLFGMIDFAQSHMDSVNLLVFTLYRDILWDDSVKEKIDTKVTIQSLVRMLGEKEGFIPAAYLHSEIDENEATWLFAIKAGTATRPLGFFSPGLYRFIHERYRKVYGRYLFISRNNVIKPLHLLKYAWAFSIRKILLKYMLLATKEEKKRDSLYFQTILLLRGAEMRNGSWDLCDACPDRIIYNGRLVPSCVLEDLKNKENERFLKVDI